ncbi:MAG: ABC transporter ATP-binding protein [Acidobacteria bacterium]|nr:ABC transporter ATP-binding protein [Acidobacteriota bacterium]
MADQLICDCRKRFPSGFTLDAALRIPGDVPVTVLFGPSGSGKSTLLRAIAGLEPMDRAAIHFRGREWTQLPPQQRRAGFLFQDYALFPHLTVAGNVAYAATPESARRAMDAFGISALAAQRPRTLSGGQQQRVALARAIAASPDLLLLDEPLSALDAPARARMRQDLRSLLLASAVPAIVVTHDRTEAIALGDWIAVMIGGRIRQSGPVQDVFRRPSDPEVAASVGVENVLPGEVAGRGGGLLTVRANGTLIQCVDSGETGAVFVCIRAEDVGISREADHSSLRNRIAATIRAVLPEGPLARVELDCGFTLAALVTAQSASELRLRPGDAVSAIIKTTSVHLVSHAGAGGYHR